jgi:hypothetical protein
MAALCALLGFIVLCAGFPPLAIIVLIAAPFVAHARGNWND